MVKLGYVGKIIFKSSYFVFVRRFRLWVYLLYCLIRVCFKFFLIEGLMGVISME